MNIFKFAGLNWLDIFLIVVFLILLVAFLKEFKLTSSRSWIILLGFTSLGGLFAFQRWRRMKLLKQFEEREKVLKELEREYDEYREKGKITREAYEQAKDELEKAKINEALAVMQADEHLAQKREEIERDFNTMTTEELLARFREALK